MYSADALRAYPFFEQLLQTTSLESLLDPQTGLVTRSYMLRFARELTERNASFTLAIIDLDNFKAVNDTYGHKVGDEVLAQAAEDLQKYVGGDGVVGRIGGDEFMLLYLKSADYDPVHEFFMNLYHSGRVFRKSVRIDDVNVFLTATTGSASFPKDAADLDELTLRADKSLYRGKSKGRNCFIIYVPAKHETLEIPALSNRSLYGTLQEAMAGFDSAEDLETKLRLAFLPMRENLHFHRLLRLSESGELIDMVSGETITKIDELQHLLEEPACALLDMSALMGRCKPLRSALKDAGLTTALISRVGGKYVKYACLVFCPEPHTERIWQDHEYAAALVLTRMLSQYLQEC